MQSEARAVSPNLTLLLIEDDGVFAQEMGEFLMSTGFRTRIAAEATSLPDLIEEVQPDVIVLDQFVGSLNTLYMLPGLRRQYDGGIVLLTNNGDELDRIIALETGSDDFIHKLQNPREIAARLRAVARRAVRSQSATPSGGGSGSAARVVVESGSDDPDFPWTLDVRRRRLAVRPDFDIAVTEMETKILLCLVHSSDAPVSRQSLHEAAQRPGEWSPTDRAIDNAISRLRKVLAPWAPDPGMLIRASRGNGYLYYGPKISILDPRT